LLKSVKLSFLNYKTINLPVETSIARSGMEASPPLRKKLTVKH